MPKAAVGLFLDALDAEEASVAAFEEPAIGGGSDDRWRIEIVHGSEPDRGALAGRLAPLAEKAGIERLDLTVAPVPRADWVDRAAADFPPQRVGRFWIHGSHVAEPPPEGTEPILIDAGLAFGSGEHESTRGCLGVIDDLARHRRFRRVLDLGCGSGVLAIAAARCWPARIVAADEDEKAVAVAAGNVQRNRVAHRVRCVRSDGLANPRVRAAGPYDLVLANILAEPLCVLARGLSRQVAPDGVVVLAGLLDRQADDVVRAYRRVGLRPLARVALGPWVTLVLIRSRATARAASARWFDGARDGGADASPPQPPPLSVR